MSLYAVFKPVTSVSFMINRFIVCRESLIFQVQVLMLFADTQEIEKQIRDLLLMPYNNGSITIATEDIEISRICE